MANSIKWFLVGVSSINSPGDLIFRSTPRNGAFIKVGPLLDGRRVLSYFDVPNNKGGPYYMREGGGGF